MLVPTDIESSIAISVMPGMLRRACDYANARIERVNGPEFTQGVPLIAEWDFLRRNLGYNYWGIGQVMFFDFIHEVDRVIAVRVGGEQIEDGRWNLRGRAGMELRNYRPWNLNIEVEYIPANNNAFRDAIAMELALLFIGFQSGALPQASGIREPGVTTRGVRDVSTQERRALARLDPRWSIIRLADRTYPKV